MGSDPVYNDPAPVRIGGRDWVCRELPWIEARRYIRRLYDERKRLAGDEDTPGVEATDGQGQAAIAVVGEGFNIADMIDQASDLVAEVMALSTETPLEEIRRLPTSVFIELGTRVLEAQEPAVRAFLAGKGRLLRLVESMRTNGSDRPRPSPASPEPDTVSATSEG